VNPEPHEISKNLTAIGSHNKNLNWQDQPGLSKALVVSHEKQVYPWTQLGYTYDWGNPESEVGLSEFVIRKGSTVVIKSVSNLDEYCR
jgi:hypothetical protein